LLQIAQGQITQQPKKHHRLVRILWNFAMWRGDVPLQQNPMELVTIKGASKRLRRPRSLTVEEFQKLARQLDEPFHTIALVCVCFFALAFASPKHWRCGGRK
jgi:hypothetical protein